MTPHEVGGQELLAEVKELSTGSFGGRHGGVTPHEVRRTRAPGVMVERSLRSLGGQELLAEVKALSTGSSGWYLRTPGRVG